MKKMKLNLQFFGGRGARLPTAHPSGGGDSGKAEWTTTPNVNSPQTLRQAMGTRGRAMSMEKAASGANPYYDGTYREFSENCQRAVVAYEARRRGYNVTAQPTYKGDTLPQSNVAGKGQDRWQGAFQGAKAEKVGAKNAIKVQQNVENKMKEYGDGSRAVLTVQWKKGNSGHALNVERKNGKTHYVDAQIGRKYNPKELFGVVKPNSVKIVRTDNLKFSDRAKKSVEQAGSRTNS